jgi:hypothetical protein
MDGVFSDQALPRDESLVEAAGGKENQNIPNNTRRHSSNNDPKELPCISKNLRNSSSRVSLQISKQDNIQVSNMSPIDVKSKTQVRKSDVSISREKAIVTPKNKIAFSGMDMSNSSKMRDKKSEGTRENVDLTESILALAGFKKKETDVLQIAESTVGDLAANEAMENLAAEVSTQLASDLSLIDGPISSRTRKSGGDMVQAQKLILTDTSSTWQKHRASEISSRPNINLSAVSSSGKRKSMISRVDDSREFGSKRVRVSANMSTSKMIHSSRQPDKVAVERSESKSSTTPTFSRFASRATSPVSSARRSQSVSAYTTPRNTIRRTSVGSAASQSSESRKTASSQRGVGARALLSTSKKASRVQAESSSSRSCSKLTVPVSPRLSTSRRSKRPADSEVSGGLSMTNVSQSSSSSRLFTPGRLTVPRSPRFSNRSASRSRREDSDTMQMRQVRVHVPSSQAD